MRVLLAPFMLLAAAPAGAQAPAGRVPTIGQYVGILRPMIGSDFGGGVRLAGVEVEGRIIVIVIDGPAGWRPAPEVATSLFLDGFCRSEPRGYFAAGYALRVDTLDAGRDLSRGTTVTACPRGAELNPVSPTNR